MYTFGDVLGLVAVLLGVCICAWTTLVVFSLLFPARATRAADVIRDSAPKMALRGFLIAAVLLIAAIVLSKVQMPLAKLGALTIFLSFLSLAALGCSGLATLVAGRVQEQEPRLSAYAALMRGAALVVVPGLLPVFGWFLVGPAMLFVGIGAATTRSVPTANP